MYCVCLEHRLFFSTRVPVQSLITANQRRTLTHVCLSFMLKTSAHRRWMGFEPTTSWSTISLAIRTPPLLANFKALNFRQWTLWRSFPVINIFQIPHVCTTFLVCNATSSSVSYYERLKRLKFDTLELLRLYIDLILCFKICNGCVALDKNDFFAFNPLSCTRGHCISRRVYLGEYI